MDFARGEAEIEVSRLAAQVLAGGRNAAPSGRLGGSDGPGEEHQARTPSAQGSDVGSGGQRSPARDKRRRPAGRETT